MTAPAITTKTTGALPQQALWQYDILDDYLSMEAVQFAWAGCMDATHVVPAGSCVASAWSVGCKKVASSTYQYR